MFQTQLIHLTIAPDQIPRKSQRLALKPRKQYNEHEDEAEMEELIGDNYDDGEEGEGGEEGQGT